jgi:hypothetical protein
MENVGIFYCHLVQFNGHLVILWSFGTFPPVLVYCTKKNLATLTQLIKVNHSECHN